MGKKRKLSGADPLDKTGPLEDQAGNLKRKKKLKNGEAIKIQEGDVSTGKVAGDVTVNSEANDKLSAEEAAKWKKRKKCYQRKRMQQPKLFLLHGGQKQNGEHKPSGDSAGVGKVAILKRKQAISLNDVLYLLEYGLLGNYTSFQPSWCKLLRVSKVSKVVLIVLNGVTSRVYRRKRHCFPNISAKSVSAKVIPALSYFAMIQDVLSHHKSFTRFKLHKHRIVAAHKAEKAKQSDAVNGEAKPGAAATGNGGESENTPKPRKTHYLVEKEEMERRGYPSATDPVCVHTRHAERVTDNSPLFGIDCEMVLTSAGIELARVSLTDEQGKTLYNSLVKPAHPVKDYVTRYSGITKTLLDPVETRLADAQSAVVDALPSDAILVGQGLENDLRALKIYHPHCVDTSTMFTASERRVKLKFLAKEYLNRDIQCGTSGHDSVEDAVAAMDLFKLKLAKGYGLKNYYGEYSAGPVFASRESIFQTAQEMNKKTCAVDTRVTLKKFKKEPVGCVVCSNDKEICKKACAAVASSDFVYVQLHGYNNLRQGGPLQDAAIETTLSLMDERVGAVINALPPNSLHVTLMPGEVETRGERGPKRGDYKARHGRCVVGLKLEKIVLDDGR